MAKRAPALPFVHFGGKKLVWSKKTSSFSILAFAPLLTRITFGDNIITKSDNQMGGSMLEALFSSRVRVRLLTIFLLNPDSGFHARALAPMVGAQYSAVWKELKNLEQAGLLFSESSASSKAYYVNARFSILPELRLIILKTAGVGDMIHRELEGIGQIEAAFVYGSFAAGDAGSQSDIDLMLVGKIDLTRLAPIIARLEKDLGRAVNYTAFTPEEWREKQHKREPFVENISNSPKVMLIGRCQRGRAPGSQRGSASRACLDARQGLSPARCGIACNSRTVCRGGIGQRICIADRAV